MDQHDRVLIVLLKTRSDWTVARDQHWYRLPLKHGPRDITANWIAFYQPGAFGEERWGIHFYARVRQVHVVRRIDLFPHEPDHPRAQQHYYVISFDPPARLANPLLSDRGRRFVWTDTTWWRFTSAGTLDEILSPEPLPAAVQDQVLVGIVPRVSDFEIANRERWYRIPWSVIESWVTPGYIAFYFGQAFGGDAGTIRYYAQVHHAEVLKRIDLFPNQPRHPRAHMDYVRVHLDAPEERSEPITSRRQRRVVLLPTTWERFMTAEDLNDLYRGDEEEEVFYGRMVEQDLKPERAYYVRGANAYYLTDYAFHCRSRNLHVDVEQSTVGQRGNSLRLARPDEAIEPPGGWSAMRLSRFDMTRRTEESVRRVRELVDASGGTVAE